MHSNDTLQILKGMVILEEKNQLTKHIKTCPFSRGSDLVALQGIVTRVKNLSFENEYWNCMFGRKKWSLIPTHGLTQDNPENIIYFLGHKKKKWIYIIVILFGARLEIRKWSQKYNSRWSNKKSSAILAHVFGGKNGKTQFCN